MSKEKQTDTFHWKERLANMESLAGEKAPGNHPAWENLHKRLHEKPARKINGWYWAAACLLLLMTIPFLLVKPYHNAGINNTVQKKQSALPPVFNQLTRKDNPVIIFSKPAERQPLQYLAEKNKPLNRHKNHSTTADQSVVIYSVTTPTASIEISPPLTGTNDSIRPVVVLAVAGQKLKVVNINDPATGSEALFTGQFKKHKQFDIQFGARNAAGKAMVFQKTSTDYHQIKIPLNN